MHIYIYIQTEVLQSSTDFEDLKLQISPEKLGPALSSYPDQLHINRGHSLMPDLMLYTAV